MLSLVNVYRTLRSVAYLAGVCELQSLELVTRIHIDQQRGIELNHYDVEALERAPNRELSGFKRTQRRLAVGAG